MKIHPYFLAILAMVTTLNMSCTKTVPADDFIGKDTTAITGDRLTPEALWAMGRIGGVTTSPDGKNAAYKVTYYSVPKNKSHSVLYALDLDTKETRLLTTSNDNETRPTFIENGSKILFLSNQGGSNQLWVMNVDGTERKQVSKLEDDIEDYLLSPNEKNIILIRQIDDYTNIDKPYDDLPLAKGMVINNSMYKHWDQFVKTIPHPFLASFSTQGIGTPKDMLEGEPYECPMLPFGGVEQLAWSPDSKTIAYTCRKKTGLEYAVSTDSDIFLYDTTDGSTRNICKPDGYVEPKMDVCHSLQNQSVNQHADDCNVGYDTNPLFSPDGKYIAWQSMERNGYESDRNRLCVYELETGKKNYVTESFESGVDTYCWGTDSKTLYFSGVWHGATMVYSTNLEGKVEKITDGNWDYSIAGITVEGNQLIVKRQSMGQADEVYAIHLNENKEVVQLTFENKAFYDKIAFGDVEERWVNTVDGKQELCWVIYPPHFDATKKYPTLLFCEGGPQAPVSQFWSFRWNFQIMAANDYIVIAPNRRGLPGFGMEWLEEISGDYTGLCMKDYLAAIDDIAKEPYVDKEHLGCVGASFGGYSVYWLAGHHDKRFKCFIAHDGIFNTEANYMETEELWFVNWDCKAAPWCKDDAVAGRFFEDSPHKSIDKWDTPILCIHGMKDYRILANQAQEAYAAARLHGVEAQLLLLEDENHWVLKPQNGILWQRTFFKWLDKWLK